MNPLLKKVVYYTTESKGFFYEKREQEKNSIRRGVWRC